MAERRMFAKSIVDSDVFLDMPISSQCLYFHLAMRADDDGFINAPKKIMKIVGASIDDMNLLIAKKFVLSFDSGVIVIKHWRIHNYIARDRYKETNYTDEKSLLYIDENKAYTFDASKVCLQNVDKLSTQNSIDKNSLDKYRLDKKRLDKYIEQEEVYTDKDNPIFTDKDRDTLQRRRNDERYNTN